jgi:hypothetical protein
MFNRWNFPAPCNFGISDFAYCHYALCWGLASPGSEPSKKRVSSSQCAIHTRYTTANLGVIFRHKSSCRICIVVQQAFSFGVMFLHSQNTLNCSTHYLWLWERLLVRSCFCIGTLLFCLTLADSQSCVKVSSYNSVIVHLVCWILSFLSRFYIHHS